MTAVPAAKPDQPRRPDTERLEREARRRRLIASLSKTGAGSEQDRLVVERAPRQASYPLALAQERFWFLNQLNPDSPADNIAVALKLTGPFDVRAYQQAWNVILGRHDILRTRFVVEGGDPVQVIDPPQPAIIRHVDLPGRARQLGEADAAAAAALEADRPFDLGAGPLYRLVVYRLSDQSHVVLAVFHHIVCDLWSLGVMSRELAALYSAFAESRQPQLPELTFRYVDFAVSHRRWQAGPAIAEQLEYWRQRLSDMVLHELPADRPRPRGPGKGATGAIDLPPDLIPAVKALARAEGATPFMVLTAAMFLVLGRYTGESDVVLGTPVANRGRLDLKSMIGTFVNTVVLRTELPEAGTFRDLLAATRETALGAFARQDVPFHRLVTELRADRAANRPLFQVLFNVQNAPVRMPELSGLEVEHVTLPRRAAQFDLTVWVDTDVLQQVGFSYDTSLFDRSTIERFIAHYIRVLRQVVASPDMALAEIDLLTRSERHALVSRPRPSSAPRSAETVLDRFDRQARLRPDAVAIEAAGHFLTYRDLQARASALARQLRGRGVGRGQLVGICVPRGAGLAAAMLGVLKSGAAYVPLDPSYPPDRLNVMLRDSGVTVVITEPALAGLLPPWAALMFANAGDSSESVGASLGVPEVDDDQLAYVIYTSGSTGVPKGVEVTHRSLANVLSSMAARPGLSAEDRLLAVTTVSFDIAALEIFLPLTIGATIVMAERDETRDAARLAALLAEHRITVMQATPSTWRMLVDAGWSGHPTSLSIWSGGEALSRELAEALLARGRSVWNLFGPTETTIWSTVEKVSSGPGLVSIGRPIANTEVHVLDAQGRPAPTGVPGELYIGGDGVARGYHNRPELTSERFVPNTIGAQGGRLYRTGDRVRVLPDGRLQWLGRFDNQVKIRGHRVEIGEVEASLGRMMGVGGSAVVPIAEPDGSCRLAAFVVARESTGISGKWVREQLARELPSYMVPARVDVLRALPLTPNQKVDRAALARLAQVEHAAGAAPATETERRLCEIWAELLDVPRVGADEDFFDLGGHSLLAVKLVLAIERELGRSLSVATLLEARTVRQLAASVEGTAGGPSWRSLVVMQPEGSKPPFFCVHGIGGEVMHYQALAARWDRDRPFISVQAIDELRAIDAERGLAALAAAYVEEVRRYQPRGPYHLGGHSLGGRIALEMSLQLEAAGEEVAFLGILDTTPRTPPDDAPRHLWRALGNAPRWFWHDAIRTPWRDNVDRLQRAVRMVGRSLGLSRADSKRPNDADVREMMNVDRLPAAIQHRYEWDYRAFRAYQPSRPCGPVTVVKASAQPLLASHAPDMGWSAVSRGPVHVVEVPGSHTSILLEPGVQRLAEELKAALDRA